MEQDITYQRLDQTYDDNVGLMEPKDKLYQWVEKLSLLLAHSKSLFIINYIIVKAVISNGNPYENWLTQVGTIAIIYDCLHCVIQSDEAKAIFV